MLKVIKYAEEKGMEKGMEKGIEKGIEIGGVKIIKRIITRKFGALPPKLSQAIDTLDSATLEILSIEILDMEHIDELRRYIPDW